LTGTDASIADPDGNRIAVRMVYYAPASVSASQGEPDGVRVTWDPVPGAAGYRVYRGESEDPEAAEALTDWLDSAVLSYLDTSATGRGVVGGGCVGPDGVTYYYWVRARKDAGHEGSLSAVAAPGYLDAEKARGSAAPTYATVLPGADSSGSAGGDFLILAGVVVLLGILSRHPVRRGARCPVDEEVPS
jgi:hypothetical protein